MKNSFVSHKKIQRDKFIQKSIRIEASLNKTTAVRSHALDRFAQRNLLDLELDVSISGSV